MRTARIATLLLTAAALCGCDDAGTTVSGRRRVPVGPGDGILFVGNSLTYANDLPGLVEGLSTAIGRTLKTASVAYPDFGLPEHWQNGDALRAIDGGGWRVVVLQQGPSSLEESRVVLREYTARFDQRIRAAGARTALYSVWPDSAHLASFPAVAESYALAAADVGGACFPVTVAWLKAWETDPSLPLYSDDGFHPSPQGSYLAALVIVGALTGSSPIGMPAAVTRADGTTLSVPQQIAALLQDAAAAALAAAAQ